MELKQIKDLMSAMGRTGIKRLKFEKDDVKVELEREDSHQPGSGPIAVVEASKANSFQSDIEQHRHKVSPSRTEKKEEKEPETPLEGEVITSPMVGTFYHSPAPTEPPFVKIGDTVNEETVVGIVEAMKVMNEIKAGVAGTVVEILMEDNHPVEFGTKLFRVE